MTDFDKVLDELPGTFTDTAWTPPEDLTQGDWERVGRALGPMVYAFMNEREKARTDKFRKRRREREGRRSQKLRERREGNQP